MTSNGSPPVDILIVDPTVSKADRPDARWLGDHLSELAAAALEPSLRDDRFRHWSPPTDLVAALALNGDRVIGYLGGGVSRDRLQLDGLVAATVVEQAEAPMLMAAMYRALAPSIATVAAISIELWGKPAEAWHRSLAEREGFEELRALHQLRCHIPLDASVLSTRPFVPGQDEERLLRVNNRSFADHPDQGGMTMEDLTGAQAASWFDPDGIRLYEDPDDPEHLAGFCWTKIHEPMADGQPRLGEVYAIGVDPDFHGRGLGKPMTASGLAWLAAQGLTVGMLYVEADNEPALRTYYKLGFEQHRTDRAWRKQLR